MSVYIIILVVLVMAMVIGPVAMMQPNPRQRRCEKLRRHAREIGLSVRLLPPPKLATDADSPAAMPVYSLIVDTPQPRWVLMRTSYTHESHLAQWWQFLGDKPSASLQRHIAGVLEMLPEGVTGLRASERQLDIFWRESGDEQAVDQLSQSLRYLAA